MAFSIGFGQGPVFATRDDGCNPAKLCWLVIIVSVITVIFGAVALSNVATGTFMSFLIPDGGVAFIILGIIWAGIMYTYTHADSCMAPRRAELVMIQ